jgi:hypothetical protein
MSDNRRVWTEDDIAKLKSMAGRFTLSEIAAELGRTKGATAIAASKLKIPLRTRPSFDVPRQTAKDASLER